MKLYRPRVSTYWWLFQRSYLKFILREISSVFVAWTVILILAQLYALSQGPQAWADLQQCLQTPALLAVNAVTFVFVVFHTVTWFYAAPRAMVVRVRGKRIPEFLIAGPHYVAWLVLSAVVAWLILGG